MPDFVQSGQITTLHDFDTVEAEVLEATLVEATRHYRLGLVLPITANDMRAEAFSGIVEQLAGEQFLDTIAVVLNRAEETDDYRECQRRIAPLGEKASVLWTDGPRGAALHQQLNETGFHCSTPGKGRAVWTAFGFLLADPKIKAFVLHDCDIVNYGREMLVRLCLPMAHRSLDFDFCKAYYARCTDRMHGRLARLLVKPLLRALMTVVGHDEFLVFLDNFRYPLSGEFAITATLARSNRTPSDWGLEVGTLAEVFRNTSAKRVCQVDLGRPYEHKHQKLSIDNPEKGLMKMAADILNSIYRTLASRGIIFGSGHFSTLMSAYLRMAQDGIRQYHADALMNGLKYDRHAEEHFVEALAEQVTTIGNVFLGDPSGMEAMPTWTRVLTAFPDFPHQLREAAVADAQEFGV